MFMMIMIDDNGENPNQEAKTKNKEVILSSKTKFRRDRRRELKKEDEGQEENEENEEEVK
jgi:hypothetical protein